MKILISNITIGERHRVDMGDLQGLADSIKAEGLLQPIGITSDNELVFGYRRLLACRDHLGWTEIEARVVNVTSIAAGEYAENEMRKKFTPSERVAILETIQRRPAHRPKIKSEDLPSFFLSREQAVKLVGLGNTTTARQAARVVASGVPELVAAMDRGDISIEPASVIAAEPAAEQSVILFLPKPTQQQRIQALATEQREARDVVRSLKCRSPTPQPPLSKQKKEKRPNFMNRPPYHHNLTQLDIGTERISGQPVQLHPAHIQRLYNDKITVSVATAQIDDLARRIETTVEEFAAALARLLAYQPVAGKTNGEQEDFAAQAREALTLLGNNADRLAEWVIGIRDAVKGKQ